MDGDDRDAPNAIPVIIFHHQMEPDRDTDRAEASGEGPGSQSSAGEAADLKETIQLVE